MCEKCDEEEGIILKHNEMFVKGYDEYDDVTQYKVKFRWEICNRCSGSGTTDNPAIDGITGEEWAEMDCDDRESYLSGLYDVPCLKCGGSGKVQVPDMDALPVNVRAAIDRYERDEAEARACERAERSMWA